MTLQVKPRTTLVFLVVMITTSLLFSVSDVRAAQPPLTAQILSITHPDQVSPGIEFGVTIVANYSDRLLADVGIWDNAKGEMIRSVTLISQFTGPGDANFSFELTAPASGGEWNLTAITRVWWKNAWYQDPRGVKSFSVAVSNLVPLTFTAQGADSTVTLDGEGYVVKAGKPVTVQVPMGLHTLEALATVEGQPGERFVFAGWSDGVTSTTRQFQVTRAIEIAAIYRTEYFLSVSSDVGGVAGSGWYEQGIVASFAAIPNYTTSAWSDLASYDYRFARWTGDSNSPEHVASVVMNGPKSVKAEFVQSGTRLSMVAISIILLVMSVPLAARALYLRTKGKSKGIGRVANSLGRPLMPLVVISVVLLSSLNLPAAQAQSIFQTNASSVKIGDSSWYYWNQTTSDTCILWLGGGISQQTYSGYNYYWVNPFEYESFGTMQFIQDLANYYCVIALQKGDYESTVPGSNRTISQELYGIQSTIIEDAHDWIKARGYQHTFLVGYSVGGQAAAMEVTLRNPEGWTTDDGIVLITVPLLDRIIDHAHSINTNLMFLYGGNLPDFVATGREFYEQAPAEGWLDGSYHHKEFHLLTDVGHEVWTVRDTGAYTRRALNMVAGFIERSKALQLGPAPDLPTRGDPALTIQSMNSPHKVQPGTIFTIEANVTYTSTSTITAGLVAYNRYSNETASVAAFDLTGSAARTVPLVVPPISNSSQGSYLVSLLVMEGEKWFRVGSPALVDVVVSDSVILTLESNISDFTVLIDGHPQTLPSSGISQFEVSRGTHLVQVAPVVPVNEAARFVFTRWGDGTDLLDRLVFVEDATTLALFYRTQYLVSASSPYGLVQGSGWYDEHSVARVLVQPVMIDREHIVFDHWEGASSDAYPVTLVSVDSPTIVEARWKSFGSSSQAASGLEFPWLIVSLAIFLILLASNLRRPRGQVKA